MLVIDLWEGKHLYIEETHLEEPRMVGPFPGVDHIHLRADGVGCMSMKRGGVEYVSLEGKPIEVEEKTSEIVVGKQFVRVGKFSEGLAPVEMKRRFLPSVCGFIDKQGTLVFKTSHYCDSGFHEGFVAAGDRFFNKKGQELLCILETEGKKQGWFYWDRVERFWNGFAAVCENEKWGIIDKNGKIVVRPKWYRITPFSKNGFACVKEREYGGWGVIDRTGKQICDCVWQDVVISKSGFFVQNDEQLWGFMDSRGNVYGKIEWDGMGRESEGYIPVRKNDQMGYINLFGNRVLPLQWDFAGEFCSGIALVIKGNDYFFINKKGEEVTQRKYAKDIVLCTYMTPILEKFAYGGGDVSRMLSISDEEREKWIQLANSPIGVYAVEHEEGWYMMNHQRRKKEPFRLPKIQGVSRGVCVENKKEEVFEKVNAYIGLLIEKHMLSYGGARILLEDQRRTEMLIWLRHIKEETLPICFYSSQDPEERELADVLIHIKQQEKKIFVQIYTGREYELEP